MTEVAVRVCEHCAGPMAERPNPRAKYCSSSCTNKAWYARHIDRERQRIRSNYQRDPAVSKAATQRWKANNREKTRAFARASYARTPETAKRSARAYRARSRGAETFVITTQDWLRCLARYRGCCAHCGKPSDSLQRDHVIPLARGGRHSVGNLVPACAPCNAGRRDRFIVEWKYRR